MIVVLAEKPSVARELAEVLGASSRRDGYYEGQGYRVTWAIGHLVALAQPDEIDPAWKAWSRATLPMFPETFPLAVLDSTKAQYRAVERLLRARDVESLIAATDAGREGELIFRLIYERAGCTKPWRRLWLSSMTPTAIRAALDKLEPSDHYDGLAAAARARSQADWIVGMNLSRAYSLTSGQLYSVGRVQTPTLAMIVERDAAIRSFVPQPYLEIEATFSSSRGTYKGTYYTGDEPTLRDDAGRLRAFATALARLPSDGIDAAAVTARASSGRADVLALERSVRRTTSPQLYDLTELQRHANRIYGYTAAETLRAAQALYETHHLLSYPRTDSRHLSTAVAATLPDIVRAISGNYGDLVAPDSERRTLEKRFVDDSRVGDHHALLPTATTPPALSDSREARIYDLVCRRLLMCWHDDLVEGVTRCVTRIQTDEHTDLFTTSGTSLESRGWTVLDFRPARPASAEKAEPSLPAGLGAGDAQVVADVAAIQKKTTPPKPHTEATLLTAMETAGRGLDDKTLTEALRQSGLGTPATRAATIETLIARRYIARAGKTLVPTQLGIDLVRAVHPLVRSAEMTGRWELRLRRLERGDDSLPKFMADIASYVRDVVAAESGKPTAPAPARRTGRGGARSKPSGMQLSTTKHR
jgi:DNA topoisomerase-3